MRWGTFTKRALQALFVAPPTIAGVFALAFLEIGQGTIYLIEALVLFAAIEGTCLFVARSGGAFPVSKADDEGIAIREQLDRDDDEERTSWSLYESGFRH